MYGLRIDTNYNKLQNERPSGPLVKRSRVFTEHIKFRGKLWADPALRSEYEFLKVALCSEHNNDKFAYTDAKTKCTMSVVR